MLSKICTPGLLQCYLCVAALFMRPLPKRDAFPIKFSFAVLVCLFCAVPISTFHAWVSVAARQSGIPVKFGIATASVLEMLLYLLLITAFFAVCCNITLLHAAYSSACAYLTQDLAYTIFTFLRPYAAHRGRMPLKPETLWLELLILVLYSLLFYWLIAVRILPHREQNASYFSALGYMLMVLFTGRILGTLMSVSFTPEQTSFFRISLLYDMLLSASLLIAQILIFRQMRYQQELAMEIRLRQQQYQQFVLFQESVDTIRHKCHDLKHMIHALQQSNIAEQSLLQEMQTAITQYDTSINSGNHTLDALLSKTWNSCEQHQIQWTCMADGKALEFMDAFDLYIMLGNALDNAVECLSTVTPVEKRFLFINIRRKGSLVLICIRNYCEQSPEFAHGLPVTTKDNKQEHGYGTRSIRAIAEKYNGQISARWQNQVFSLNIMLPITP